MEETNYTIHFEDNKAEIINQLVNVMCDITESLDTLEEMTVTIHIKTIA